MSTDPLTLAAAFALGVIATARAVRLIVFDDFPPVAALRAGWLNLTRHGRWSALVTCPFCLAPYAAAGNLAWALLTDLDTGTPVGAAWWVVNVWAAVSYLAPMLVLRDEPPPVDPDGT